MRLLLKLTVVWALMVSGLLAQARTAERPVLNVTHYQIELELIPENAYLRGSVRVEFDVQEEIVSVPFDLNSRVSLIEVTDAEGMIYSPSFDSLNSSRMLVRGDEPFEQGSRHELIFSFDGTLEPEDYAYLDDTAQDAKAVIDKDGAILLSEGFWFPSHHFRTDPATFEVKVTVPLGFTVVAPGELQPIETIGIKESFTWKSSFEQSGLPVLVSRYFRQQFETEPIPITFFSTEDFEGDIQPWIDELVRIVDFYKKEYGPLPAVQKLNLAELGNVRIPSTGGLGLILLESKLLGRNSVPVMELARRVANQWWYYTIQVRSGYDLWLQESFSQYAAYRYIETLYADRALPDLARLSVEALKYEERAPILEGLSLGPGTAAFESVVSAKGFWVLYMLRQLIGEKKFHQILNRWFLKSSGGMVSTAEYLDHVNAETGDDYGWFFLQWVESTGVPEFEIEYRVYKKQDGSFRIRGQIKQNLELFRMPVDVRIHTKGQPEEKHMRVSGKSTAFNFETETMPVRIELDPDGKILRDSERMRIAVHISLGEEFQEIAEYLSAVREFEKARELDPRSSLAHFRIGETYFLQHSYSNAANSFRDTLNGDLKPEWVEAWTHIHLGKIYDILGQRQRAMAEYTKAVNSKIDYLGAQAEAQRYINEPFTKPRTVLN
jgi:tetratricopeptide (TPR) repeat protein